MAFFIPSNPAEREEFLFKYNLQKTTTGEVIPLEEVSDLSFLGGGAPHRQPW